jgi:hypothetical protein
MLYSFNYLLAPVAGFAGRLIVLIGLLIPLGSLSKYGLNGSNASGVFLASYGISILESFACA